MDKDLDHSYLLNLPPDLRRQILSGIPIEELRQIATISDRYKQMVEDDELWRFLLKRDLPHVRPDKVLSFTSPGEVFDDLSYYFAYSFIYETINDIVYDLGPRYLAINPKYLNDEALYDEIYQSLLNFINRSFSGVPEDPWMLHDYSGKLAELMSGLSPDALGEYVEGKYDVYRQEINYRVETDLKEYLNDLGLFIDAVDDFVD